jgi:Ca2+-binding EF-hand superfamily protein
MDNSIVWTLLIGAAVVWAFWKFVWPKADVNNDGKVDVADVKTIADVNKDGKIDTADVKTVADVNKDGKVDTTDAVEVVKKTTTRAKKIAAKTAAKTKGTK